MALRFIESFDHYSQDDFMNRGYGYKWDNIFFNVTNSMTFKPGRTYNCLRIDAQQVYLTKVLDPQSTWILGFALRYTSGPNPPVLAQFYDNTTSQMDLRLSTSGILSVTRGGTALTSNTSSIPLSSNTWYFIEWYLTIANSLPTNGCIVRINGVDAINIPAGQDTQGSTVSTANILYFGIINPQSGAGWAEFDDFYLCDGTGSSPLNTFLGDIKVEAKFPNNLGTLSQWSSSSSSPIEAIKDSISNGDQNYIYSLIPNNESSFLTAPLSVTPATIYGLQLTHNSRKTDAGTKKIQDFIRRSGTNYPGSQASLSNEYNYYSSIYPLDPSTSSPWTAANLNAAEIGLKNL